MDSLQAPPACYRFIVNGRVQGVFFRQSSKQRADALGLRGWVRNRADGGVEGEVCGEPAALEIFRAWLQRGPSAARVDSLSWEFATAAVDGSDFEVRR